MKSCKLYLTGALYGGIPRPVNSGLSSVLGIRPSAMEG